MINLALLHTGLRGDEKLIMNAAKERNVNLELIDVRKSIFNPRNLEQWQKFDIILERCVSTVRGNAAIEFLDNMGFNIINNSHVVSICNDKFRTASILDDANVPNLKSVLVFGEEQAMQVVSELGGYPVVIKSREGSWGRLMGKINDEDALESIFEHRKFMGPEQNAVVVQEYVEKPNNRDIRAFVIDSKCICAIYRQSSHWITNTARGAVASNCPLNDELVNLCRAASRAVGGGILAVDIFETNDGLKINEVNHTMEFRNSEAPTGVSISGAIIDFCIKSVKSK